MIGPLSGVGRSEGLRGWWEKLAQEGSPQVSQRIVRHAEFSTTLKHYTQLELEVLGACTSSKQPAAPEPPRLVEASCGQCNFDLPGDGCDLAVRIDGKAYFVDGTSIDEHGDAHAADGMCNAIRKARVEGDVSEGRFQATFFELLHD